jgi:SnoaL-like domain
MIESESFFALTKKEQNVVAQTVTDKFEITEQIYRYCRSVDRLDVALGHSVFHSDSYADFGQYKGPGRGWIDFICAEHRKFLHHSHQVTNIIIDVDGDQAGSEAYVTATLRARDDQKLIQRQFWARYVDRWSRRNGGWAIDRRECVIDFASINEVQALGEHQRSQRDHSDPSYEVLSGSR